MTVNDVLIFIARYRSQYGKPPASIELSEFEAAQVLANAEFLSGRRGLTLDRIAGIPVRVLKDA